MTILLLWHKFRKNINICRFYVPFLKILFLTLGETLFPTGVWPVGLRLRCSPALLCHTSRAVISYWALGSLLSTGRWRICTKNDFKAIKPGTFILATRNQKHFYKEKYKSSGTLRRAASHQRSGVLPREWCRGAPFAGSLPATCSSGKLWSSRIASKLFGFSVLKIILLSITNGQVDYSFSI